MVDHYTKVLLTVIAVALMILVVRPAWESRPAAAQGLAVTCGTFDNPCYVTGVVSTAITNWPQLQAVTVVNWPTVQAVHLNGTSLTLPVCVAPSRFLRC